MTSNTCRFAVGRLLEIQVAGGLRTVEDIDDISHKVAAAAAKVPLSEKFAIVSDWRCVHVMPPDTAACARDMLMSVNPRVSRSAILTLPENSTSTLQLIRLIREAENANRRHFTSSAELSAWLSQVLSLEETARLSVFLSPS